MFLIKGNQDYSENFDDFEMPTTKTSFKRCYLSDEQLKLSKSRKNEGVYVSNGEKKINKKSFTL